MELSDAFLKIKDEPDIINAALNEGILSSYKEEIKSVVKEEPEIEIYDVELETIDLVDISETEVETIDITDEENTPNTNEPDPCKNCPKIVTAAGKVQQIHYCYTADDKATKYKSPIIYKSRKREIQEYKFKCDLCDKIFIHNTELTIHKRIHKAEQADTKEYNFKCAKCKKGFMYGNVYKGHMQTAHGEDVTSSLKMKFDLEAQKIIQSSEFNEETLKFLKLKKKFNCDLCAKVFEHESELFVHNKVHKVVNKEKSPVREEVKDVISTRKLVKMIGVNSEGKPFSYDVMVYT